MEFPGSKYATEYHKVTTQDGYILTLLRVVHKPIPVETIDNVQNLDVTSQLPQTPIVIENKKPPVLLVHGAQADGNVWLMNHPDVNLPNKLLSNDYDCWIANMRGTRLSRAHETLKTTSRKFWDFSGDDIGLYDIPSLIDYILDVTGHKQLHYVGHSLGGSVYFVLMSTKPEYQEKVKSMIGLAPAAFVTYICKPIKFVAPIFNLISKSRMLRRTELGSKTFLEIIKTFSPPIRNPIKMSATIAAKVGTLGGLFHKNHVNKDLMPIFVTNFPASTSMKTICHGMQCVFRKRFGFYDYGPTENLKRYGQERPPDYQLGIVNTPVTLFYSKWDKQVPYLDVLLVADALPNVAGIYGVNEPKFGHVDFLMAKDADKLVYDKIIEVFDDSYKSENI